MKESYNLSTIKVDYNNGVKTSFEDLPLEWQKHIVADNTHEQNVELAEKLIDTCWNLYKNLPYDKQEDVKFHVPAFDANIDDLKKTIHEHTEYYVIWAADILHDVFGKHLGLTNTESHE